MQSEVLLFRSRYNDVAGSEALAEHAKTVPADVTTMNVRQLRAELMTIAEHLRYLYTFIPPRKATRNRLATSAGIWTLIAAMMGGGVYYYTTNSALLIPSAAAGRSQAPAMNDSAPAASAPPPAPE
ncbi:MAG TPA: hypothetical protein VGU66_07095 [Candidatus Elarobacter sp.]|nr:hypothetical protein [Candidatus Elarobacter sp.]